MDIKIGALLWPQTDSWPALRDAALRADRAGYDSLWTWDHLNAIVGPWQQPILEGWTTLAGLAAVTEKPTLGLMVGANTFRNPGLTAKLATTLDHISGGRAILGIGGAWFEREHDAFGIETWGSGFGERLDRLDEAVMLMRRLLDGEIVTHEGRFYRFHDALCAPRPVQARLPILIGGSGPKKTLRTVAERGDAWNTSGTLDEVRGRLDILDEHCAAVGRDRGEIELTVSFPITIRDDAAAAQADTLERFRKNGVENAGDNPHLAGPPSLVADAIAPFRDLGFETVICRMQAPFDRETIDRMPEVWEQLD
jgi:alkanesulfonate monooxygenase SsuD/methylene tetrahydromethanopterin reductase-like flavin-dependent oxidoreductase (luciferase family)